MSSAKNNHVVYIPDHVIVRYARDVLNLDATAQEQAIRDRLRNSVASLCAYAKHLALLRSDFDIDYRKFGYGM